MYQDKKRSRRGSNTLFWGLGVAACAATAADKAAAAYTPAAARAGGAASPVTFAAGGELDLGIQLFVGGVLLLTAACFAWLLYLMITCPPEGEAALPETMPLEAAPIEPGVATLLQLLPGAAPQASVDTAFDRPFGQLLRGWLNTRISLHIDRPGPM